MEGRDLGKDRRHGSSTLVWWGVTCMLTNNLVPTIAVKNVSSERLTILTECRKWREVTPRHTIPKRTRHVLWLFVSIPLLLTVLPQPIHSIHFDILPTLHPIQYSLVHRTTPYVSQSHHSKPQVHTFAKFLILWEWKLLNGRINLSLHRFELILLEL
jgi:hypothetical protein